MKNKSLVYLGTLLSFLFVVSYKAQTIYEPRDLSKVESSLKDMGKMWTFDDVPLDYFEKEYGFRPTQEWLDDVRMSALQFGGGCSAAFVSADGLIMTNHHCGRGSLQALSPKGDDYLRDGFYAQTITDEIKVPNLFVDQLMMIEDVTKEVLDAMKSGKDDNEKVKMRNDKIKEIEDRYSKDTGLTCRIVQLYNGGKYSLYGYTRYTDIRLVMAPDFQIASTGWDWDNFTYPRYELDFMFYRAYENEKPIKTDHYFKWSKNGADEGEPIFVVGRPGSTQRLYSAAQLEFLRDKNYKYTLSLFNELYKVSFELFKAHPERFSELLNSVMGVGNSRKSFAGRYMALRDEYIMTKKRNFEKNLIEKVDANPELKQRYGHIWGAIKNNIDESRKYVDEYLAFTLSQRIRNLYISAAQSAINFAKQMQLPVEKRDAVYKPDSLDNTIRTLFPVNYDPERDNKMLRALVNFMSGVLGENHLFSKTIFGGKTGEEAVNYLLSVSKVSSKEKLIKFLKESNPEEILSSSDPFITLIQYATKKLAEIEPQYKEITNTLTVLNQQLGEIAFQVYGDVIPPDATSTLRISDGRIEGFEYNGTIAPGKTTYFGLWDRWNSFGKKNYPWGLHPRWQKIPEGLDLSTPISWASTNDIVGGNSGSSAINKNKEVVGLVHDGNLESLAGDFIFLPENNRTVATDSCGLMEALKYVYKTDRLVNELQNGRTE